MKLKMILLMLLTLSSVFFTIFISNIYSSFVAPYLIGFITPIIINSIYEFEPHKKDKK